MLATITRHSKTFASVTRHHRAGAGADAGAPADTAHAGAAHAAHAGATHAGQVLLQRLRQRQLRHHRFLRPEQGQLRGQLQRKLVPSVRSGVCAPPLRSHEPQNSR